jgi:hypothetical protein
MTWLLYMTPPNKQAAVSRELRQRGIEPFALMAFPHTRVNRHTKAKRPNPAIKPRYIGPYVALDLTPEQEYLISRPDWLPVAIRPVPQPMGRRPVLSPAGVRFWTQPPRGLFRDVDIPRLKEETGVKSVHIGDKVGVYSHGFAGVDAEVIAINGEMTRVRFKDGMFAMEASVPVETLVRVA